MEQESKMPKFMCITQVARLTTFRGPSGTRYHSAFNQYFDVSIKEDVEHFANFPQRFKKKGMLDKGPMKEKDVDQKLVDEMLKIKGVSKTTADKVAMIYNNLDSVIDVFIEDNELDDRIPAKQAGLISKWVHDKFIDVSEDEG